MTDIRIAGGEMTRELYEFRDLIVEGALDVLQPDVALVGGITGLRRVALWPQITISCSRRTPGPTAWA